MFSSRQNKMFLQNDRPPPGSQRATTSTTPEKFDKTLVEIQRTDNVHLNLSSTCCFSRSIDRRGNSMKICDDDDDVYRKRIQKSVTSNLKTTNTRKNGDKNFNYYYYYYSSIYLLILNACLSYFICILNIKGAKSCYKKWLFLLLLTIVIGKSHGFSNEFEKTEQFLDKINLEQSIAAVFNKVAYGSTTKRSIPDTAYPITTLATPLLTTYRYSDGSEEFYRVDIKKQPENEFEYESNEDGIRDFDNPGYGANLEKDHVLPTTAPAADILKNNNNKNYENPNRYNNDRLKPNYNDHQTENPFKTTTGYNPLRNVRPTKSIYSKDVPSYVPPSRAFFTPPLPPEYLNPFADKPTLRGTNSDGFGNRRPIPPPSLMPNKDRIPFRPDIPNKVNIEKVPERPNNNFNPNINISSENERKKTLNTPSNVNLDRLGEFYGGQRVNESSFEYEKGYIPSITRILSGSNGRHDDISDILLKSVTATPNLTQKNEQKTQRNSNFNPNVKDNTEKDVKVKKEEIDVVNNSNNKESNNKNNQEERLESVTIKKETLINNNNKVNEMTTQSSEFNLKNVENGNKTKSTDEIWLICWNVHVYLVVLGFVILALYSIYKLIRYETTPHMFSKSSFLTIHLMLTVICLLRIFYLMYDPYNINRSLNIFLYDFFHNFPLSLLATTFAVLILFLLKRTLTHLKVKAKPVFLVIFGVIHIFLCFCLSISETLGHFEKASLIVCKPVFVLLSLSLGVSYLYLYRIIKNVLAKKSQNLSEICTQNISYASHVTIAVALLFILLGGVHLYALFIIKIDRFSSENHHWLLWGYELLVRFLEISIVSLLATVVSLKMSPREKQTTSFPLFPCATSESSSDNMYPNNCNTNPNVTNYSRNEMILDNLPNQDQTIERPNLLKNTFQNDSFDKKSTLERHRSDDHNENQTQPQRFERFERPKWGSDRFENRNNLNPELTPGGFERNSSRSDRNSSRKPSYDAKYYTKPKYDVEYNNDDYQRDVFTNESNVYSEPLDHANQYERTRHEFERNDFDRRSRNSSNTSGRRSTTGRSRKNQHPRPHLGVQTLPNHDVRIHQNVIQNMHQNVQNQINYQQGVESMLETDQGFVRFRLMQEIEGQQIHGEKMSSKRQKKQHNNDIGGHYSDD
nr:uncharacterized protein LOC111428900 [Onthophagus taurus]